MQLKKFKNPIFVCGYMHSGTTLMRDILRKNEDVFAPRPETGFFEFLDFFKKAFSNLKDKTIVAKYLKALIMTIEDEDNWQENRKKIIKDFAEKKQVEVTTNIEALQLVDYCVGKQHEEIFYIVFDYLTQKHAKKRWVEKTPRHAMHINTIFKYIPDALILVMIRDPRDIFASKKVRRLRKKYPYSLLVDTFFWKQAIQAALSARKKYPKNVLCVRYENLVSEPYEKVKEICSFLKLSCNQKMLDVQWRNSANRNNIGKAGMGTQSVEKWKSVLSEEEIAATEAVTKKEMLQVGYVPTCKRKLRFSKSIALILYSFFDILARLYRKHKFFKQWHFINIIKETFSKK